MSGGFIRALLPFPLPDDVPISLVSLQPGYLWDGQCDAANEQDDHEPMVTDIAHIVGAAGNGDYDAGQARIWIYGQACRHVGGVAETLREKLPIEAHLDERKNWQGKRHATPQWNASRQAYFPLIFA